MMTTQLPARHEGQFPLATKHKHTVQAFYGKGLNSVRLAHDMPLPQA